MNLERLYSLDFGKRRNIFEYNGTVAYFSGHVLHLNRPVEFPSRIHSVALFQKQLAIGLDGEVRIVHADSLEVIQTLEIQRVGIMSFDSTGRQLACLNETQVVVWNLDTKKFLRAKSSGQEVTSILFDRNVLVTSGVGHIKFWRIENTFTGMKLQGQNGKFGVSELSDIHGFVNGKVLVSSSEHGWILVWEDGLIKAEVWIKEGVKCHNGVIDTLFVDDDQLLTFGSDGFLRVWKFEQFEQIQTSPDSLVAYIKPEDEIMLEEGARISHILKINGVFMLQDMRGIVWEFNFESRKLTEIIRSHAVEVISADYSPDFGHLVTVGEEGNILLTDTRKKTLVGTFTGSYASVAYIKESYLLVGTTDGFVRLVRYFKEGEDTELQNISELRPHKKAALVQINMDANLAMSKSDNEVFFFRLDYSSEIPFLAPIGFVTGSFKDTCLFTDHFLTLDLNGIVSICDLSKIQTSSGDTYQLQPLNLTPVESLAEIISIRRSGQVVCALDKQNKLTIFSKELKTSFCHLPISDEVFAVEFASELTAFVSTSSRILLINLVDMSISAEYPAGKARLMLADSSVFLFVGGMFQVTSGQASREVRAFDAEKKTVEFISASQLTLEELKIKSLEAKKEDLEDQLKLNILHEVEQLRKEYEASNSNEVVDEFLEDYMNQEEEKAMTAVRKELAFEMKKIDMLLERANSHFFDQLEYYDEDFRIPKLDLPEEPPKQGQQSQIISKQKEESLLHEYLDFIEKSDYFKKEAKARPEKRREFRRERRLLFDELKARKPILRAAPASSQVEFVLRNDEEWLKLYSNEMTADYFASLYNACRRKILEKKKSLIGNKDELMYVQADCEMLEMYSLIYAKIHGMLSQFSSEEQTLLINRLELKNRSSQLKLHIKDLKFSLETTQLADQEIARLKLEHQELESELRACEAKLFELIRKKNNLIKDLVVPVLCRPAYIPQESDLIAITAGDLNSLENRTAEISRDRNQIMEHVQDLKRSIQSFRLDRNYKINQIEAAQVDLKQITRSKFGVDHVELDELETIGRDENAEALRKEIKEFEAVESKKLSELEKQAEELGRQLTHRVALNSSLLSKKLDRIQNKERMELETLKLRSRVDNQPQRETDYDIIQTEADELSRRIEQITKEIKKLDRPFKSLKRPPAPAPGSMHLDNQFRSFAPTPDRFEDIEPPLEVMPVLNEDPRES